MPINNTPEGVILGLDIGASRVGVARAHTLAKLPEPLTIINVNDELLKNINDIAKNEEAILLVIGLPIPLNGIPNAQTDFIKNIADAIHHHTGIPYVFVDEAFSSKQADDYLKSHNARQISNDAIASCIILERYFTEGQLNNA